MAIITVNDHDIEIGDAERLNCIQAADRAGVNIPFYCWHPGLSVVASCRMCLVETGTRNEKGEVQMGPKLVPACQTPAKHGTVIRTNTDKVRANQQFVQEYLLVDHPIDCPICDQAGECWLQDYYFQYGHAQRRADVRPFTSRRRDVGEHVTLFVDRCVMCSRCVRFTREISGTGELAVIQRGHEAEIDVFPGQSCNNKLSGNVVDICPVGALCSKDFLYQQRAWFLRSHASVCTRCSAGCSIVVDENQQQVYRLRPRYNPNANQWWMCDIGRYGFDYVHSPQRITAATRLDQGVRVALAPEEVAPAIHKALTAAAAPGGVAGVFSPFLTCEEAWLLASYLRSMAPRALLALGPIPVEGEDETYPRGFVIRAERCPNRRGVEAVLAHFQEKAATFADVLSGIEQGTIQGAYLTAGYPDGWPGGVDLGVLNKLSLLIVQDVLSGPLSEAANIAVPGLTFAEKSGSYVNHGELLQAASRAIRPLGEARGEGQTFWDLCGRSGLYDAEAVRKELAAAVAYFAPADGAIPEHGLPLGEPKPTSPLVVLTTMPGSVSHPMPDARAPGAVHQGR